MTLKTAEVLVRYVSGTVLEENNEFKLNIEWEKES